MDNLARIEFAEQNEQWLVELFTVDGKVLPGEPFPAYGGENFSKLEQVLRVVKELGYRPEYIPYGNVNARKYTFVLIPL